jgi:nucleotide-binding universal stress UspA family protein
MTENGTSQRGGVVVVGVDGSTGSREALRWAIAEARLRRTPLRAVHAWTIAYPGVPGGGYGYMGGGYGYMGTPPLDASSVEISTMRQAAEELLDRALVELSAEAEGVQIERQVPEGGAAAALMEAAGADDLLVVGSRGHGGFASLLLGSVSQQCAHHASCPVVIVHPPTPSANGVEPAGHAEEASTPAA